MQLLNLIQKQVIVVLLVSCFTIFFQVNAAEKIPETAFANMPVKEVTVFKDGHTFVLHEGQMPTDADGNIELDYLPRPIIGTFWSYSADSKAKLTSVVSGKRIVSIDRTALNIPELIRANVGAKVKVSEVGLDAYECTIFAIPSRSTEELQKTSPESNSDELPIQGNIVLLKYEGGIRAVPIDKIQEITFIDGPKHVVDNREFRNIMTLKLDWNKSAPSKTANVGMMYVQKGIRWIPDYRVEIDGKGQAIIKLQATIINELADIENVKANLVIGVPKFAFQDTVDPISLQQTVAQLSSSFQNNSRTAYSFSNAIMSQQADISYRHAEPSANSETIDLGPEVATSGKNEDLYIFTLDNITLKKGQRMVVPIGEYKLKYKDVYVLDLPFSPPPEVRERFNNDQMSQLAKLYNAPKAMHKIRISNTADCPLTTAPALILRDGRIIAQGMMTYTAIGASCDLDLTDAIDISVKKSDEETERIPNAVTWNNNQYFRSNLTGKISLTNRRTDTIELEIKRSVLGTIDKADNDGKIIHVGGQDEWVNTDGFPSWWSWYSWPYWWYYFNPVGQVNWDLKLKPNESISLEYKWHYFWHS
jgi:hypothetical protein